MVYIPQSTGYGIARERDAASSISGRLPRVVGEGFLYGLGQPQRLTALSAIRARSAGSSRRIVPSGRVAETNPLQALRSRSSLALIKAASVVKVCSPSRSVLRS